MAAGLGLILAGADAREYRNGAHKSGQGAMDAVERGGRMSKEAPMRTLAY
jgi:hypothetical protein